MSSVFLSSDMESGSRRMLVSAECVSLEPLAASCSVLQTRVVCFVGDGWSLGRPGLGLLPPSQLVYNPIFFFLQENRRS